MRNASYTQGYQGGSERDVRFLSSSEESESEDDEEVSRSWPWSRLKAAF